MEQQSKGVCAVCGNTADLKCGGCKEQFYCNRGHQKQDWQKHKITCQPWEICENRELGRHLVAKRDLNPGDLIICESPLVWGPALHTDQRICVGCGKQCMSSDRRCVKCHWPACEINCAGLTDKNKHGLECSVLSKGKIIPRSDVLLPIRILRLWHIKSKRWVAMEKLQSHEISRGLGTGAYEETMDMIRHIERLFSEHPASREMLQKICGLIDVNALETAPPEGAVAIYEIACLLEHNCLANTRHSFSTDGKGNPRITVKAVCSIKKGDHISTMYTHALWATRARRAHLFDTKYFSCRCERCGDPTELGTHLGTLRCPQGDGWILPENPLDPKTNWQCDACPGVLSTEEVAKLTERLEEEVDQVMKHAKKDLLIDLLSRLTALLHPGHQHCITVSHTLIQLLVPTDPRKRELCKRIIDTTGILDPYGARLPLYTAVALRELSNCPGEDTKALLSRAVSLLITEPPNSPGEKFRNYIESDLSYL